MGNTCLGKAKNFKEDGTDNFANNTIVRSSVAQQSMAIDSLAPQASIYSKNNTRSQSNSVTTSFQPYRGQSRSLAPSVTSSVAFSDTMSNYTPTFNIGQPKGNSELHYQVPSNTNIVTDAVLLDPLSPGDNRGVEYWRADSEQYGLILAKVVYDPDDLTQTSFENELKMLNFVQNSNTKSKSKGNAAYRSRSPFKAGYESDVFKYQHDNIVGFIGYMETHADLSNPGLIQRLILTEFYVDTLRDHISHRTQSYKKEMRHYEAFLYCFQIAKGLHSLHKMKVVHRDLNPENIVMGLGLLDREYKEWLKYVAKAENRRALESYQQLNGGAQRLQQHQAGRSRHQQQQHSYYKFLSTQPLVAKIANLGNAKRVVAGRTHTLMGNPQHRSPEMFKREYSHPTDIWSFGMIVYEMIFKQIPFYKKNPSYIEEKILKGKLPKPEYNAPKNFDPLQTVMRNCLRTDPTLRCKAKDLVEDLGNL